MNRDHVVEQLEAAFTYSVVSASVRRLEAQGAVVTEAEPTIDELGGLVLNYTAVMPLAVEQIRLEFRAAAS